MLEIAPEIDPAAEDDVATDDDIFCAACGHAVTKGRWRISMNGDHEHTVFNPAGRVFCVLCFSDAPGTAAIGEPSGEFTWFKGFDWRIALCLGCDTHIGWRFEGERVFFGLIKTKLTTQKT